MEKARIDNLALWAERLSFTPAITQDRKTRLPTFSNLPREMKELIWELTIEPRVISIYAFDESRGKFGGNAPIPSTLSVSREWRRYFMTLHPLCFGSNNHAPKIRFNGAVDSIFINEERCLFNASYFFYFCMSKKEAATVRYLVFDEHFKTGNGWETCIQEEVIANLTALEHLTVIGDTWCKKLTDEKSDEWEVHDGCRKCEITDGSWMEPTDTDDCIPFKFLVGAWKLFRTLPREKLRFGYAGIPDEHYINPEGRWEY
ncbi:uncharacterized protein LY89DRAFT_782270 [Mollisia scopiformis]|uniref:2EXR domain-containing protein n=1 Tax=Mollisia scopiformis TaxID=149040 RepID=A0A194XA66_MOLSC|nr:uncharacterized protein LY89DRAFT_782270 [Mollisia scopiformis]KUJ17063.1 hypothetical protein LY89DRAFT_782270 [Mollisia scopiformis]